MKLTYKLLPLILVISSLASCSTFFLDELNGSIAESFGSEIGLNELLAEFEENQLFAVVARGKSEQLIFIRDLLESPKAVGNTWFIGRGCYRSVWPEVIWYVAHGNTVTFSHGQPRLFSSLDDSIKSAWADFSYVPSVQSVLTKSKTESYLYYYYRFDSVLTNDIRVGNPAARAYISVMANLNTRR